MSAIEKKIQCFSYSKFTRTLNCAGCFKDFCMNCLPNHLQMLSKELDEIEYNHDLFRQLLNDRKDQQVYNQVIKEIDQWEEDSIKKIKETGEECRKRVINHTKQVFRGVENKLVNIGRELKIIRQENQFNEIDLNDFKEKFDKLQEELNRTLNFTIQQPSTPFLNKIIVNIPFHQVKQWNQHGSTIAGGNGSGNALNQLSYPFSMVIINDETILISDNGNDRIVQWESSQQNGRIVLPRNGNKDRLFDPTDFLVDKKNDTLIVAECGNRRVVQWSFQNHSSEHIISDIYCLGLTIDSYGVLYVSDCESNAIVRWINEENEERVVAGGNGVGGQLNQLNGPNFIFVDDEQSIYISDEKNHRVMKWFKDAKEGIVVAEGNGQGNSLRQLSFPQGVIVDQLGRVYVADRDNHRIMRWSPDSNEGTIVVGGNGRGIESNQFNLPIHLSFDLQENLYVVDHDNHRIQKFEIN